MTQTQHLRIEIDGMTCAGCAGRAERAISAVPGVENATVNFANRSAELHAARGAEGAIVEALDRAGYPARLDTVTLEVSEMTCASCASRVEKALTALPGVVDAAVNFAAGTATVQILADAVTPAELARAASDAGYPTAPAEDGDGGYRAMQGALRNAGIEPGDVDYINAHGTSTMADTIELKAVEKLLGDAASTATMSSTKSSTGHLLGAAGAIEGIFSILAIRDQVAPPTINLDNPAVETPMNLAANAKHEREIKVALSNSFGFGGTNACLCLGAVR